MSDLKNKLLGLIKIKGPVVPNDIAKEINADLIFAGAILSEMAGDKLLQISNLKVGGSPLYFLSEQKNAIENFTGYLIPKERDVFELLKKEVFVEDDALPPAERIAIRDLKDFAIPIKVTYDERNYLFWRFYSALSDEVAEKIKNLLEKRKLAIKPEAKPEVKAKPRLKKEKEEAGEKKEEGKIEKIVEEIKEKKEMAKKPKEPQITAKALAFREKILEYAKNNSINVLEEKNLKNKEITFVASINSDIGQLHYLVVAKDKKSVNDADLSLAYHEGQNEKLPVLFIANGKLTAKGKNHAESLKGHLVFKQMK